MNLLKHIKRLLDKLPASPGLIKPGKWYVTYPDGQRYVSMTYDVCQDYAKIFGGTVSHIEDEKDDKDAV